MQHSAEMRRCLVECDVAGIRRLWHHLSPHLPLPNSVDDTICAIHMARTVTNSIPLKHRAYSHNWLVERGMPSQLPDRLRPRAERLYKKPLEAVGIATLGGAISGDPDRKAISDAVRKVMEDVVMDYYSTDRSATPDPMKVKEDMMRQRKEFRRRLVDIAVTGWRK